MDLDSSITHITEQLPDLMSQSSSFIPEELSQMIWHAKSYLPVEINLYSTAKFMLYFTLISLILGVLGRFILGKRSSLNLSVSSAIGILSIYALSVVIFTFKPWNLDQFLTPLPFASFTPNYLILLPITDLQFPALCTQLLSLIILSFLVNLVDTIMPSGKNPFSWLILRIITIILCMGLHLASGWAARTYLPDFLVSYAPVILLLILVFCLLSGLVSLIIGAVIAIADPFLGAMYAFFFSNFIGKQLSKAVFSSIIISSVLFLMDYFGYTVICISTAALLTYIPLAILLILLWYMIGSVL